MDKITSFELVGKILSITQRNSMVHIIVENNNDKILVEVPRKNCNPRKWARNNFVKIVGKVSKWTDAENDCKYKVSFSQAVITKLFTEDSFNEKIDYAGDFSFVGYITHAAKYDDEFYRVVIQTEECREFFTIYIEKDAFEKIMYNFDCLRLINFSGKIAITSYCQYCLDVPVSRIQYFATSVNYV